MALNLSSSIYQYIINIQTVENIRQSVMKQLHKSDYMGNLHSDWQHNNLLHHGDKYNFFCTLRDYTG